MVEGPVDLEPVLVLRVLQTEGAAVAVVETNLVVLAAPVAPVAQVL